MRTLTYNRNQRHRCLRRAAHNTSATTTSSIWQGTRYCGAEARRRSHGERDARQYRDLESRLYSGSPCSAMMVSPSEVGSARLSQPVPPIPTPGSARGTMLPFRILEHTADVGFEAFGRTKEEVFANAGRALYSLMVDLDSICAVARGEKFDRARHQIKLLVKAITYHQLALEKTKSGWRAQVYVDI